MSIPSLSSHLIASARCYRPGRFPGPAARMNEYTRNRLMPGKIQITRRDPTGGYRIVANRM